MPVATFMTPFMLCYVDMYNDILILLSVMVAYPMSSFTTFDLRMKKPNKTMYVLYYRDRGILDWMKFYFHITTRKGFYKSFRTMKKTQNMSRMASILHGWITSAVSWCISIRKNHLGVKLSHWFEKIVQGIFTFWIWLFIAAIQF